ncbi:MAG TPA: PAS domain S-box protein [Methanotrichaceae archaeon]|nr:PAS domain S-box protein [Methanotrichaceae archaeon]
MDSGSPNHNEVMVPEEYLRRLHETEERHSAVVGQAMEIIFLVDLDTKRLIEVNPAFQRILGYTAEEAIGLELYDIIAHDKESIDLNIHHIQREKCYFIGERQYRHKDGSLVDVEVNAYLIAYSGKEALCVMARDITEHKWIEEAYRALVDNSLQGLVIFQDNSIAFANKAFIEMIGYTLEELRTMSPEEVQAIIYSEDRAFVWSRLMDRTTGKDVTDNYQFRVVQKDGYILWLDMHSSVIEYWGKPAIQSAVIDITERKRIEGELKDSQDQLRKITDNMLDMVSETDTRGIYKYASPSHKNVLGYSPDELLGKSVFALIHPDDLERVATAFQAAISTRAQGKAEYRYRHKDGRYIWIEAIGNILFDETGSINGAVFSKRDVSERKQIEASLHDHLNFLQQLMDAIPAPIFYKDLRGVYLGCNRAFENYLGRKREEIIGRSVYDLSPRDLADKYYEMDQKLFEKPGTQVYESSVLYADGTRHDVIFNKATFTKADGSIDGLVGVILDITERKQAEDMLKKSLVEKEILLKEIHHRVKNNLQVITSLLNIQASYLSDEDTKDILVECQNRVKSMALIHENLYRSENLGMVNFADYIRNLIEALFRAYKVDKRRIRHKLDLDTVFLEIDQSIPCGLILIELVTNSLKHAFPKDGKGEIQIELRLMNDMVMLTVRDNGIGLPEDLDIKKTYSMGLKIINGLVRQLRGTIETDLSNGTEFKITFAMSR